ncbi:MAG: hypothetical protein KJ872_06275 [Alphaproteobacteria bacterium]|nr:hypothetical protein [Alphaproteobacteria bacterium]
MKRAVILAIALLAAACTEEATAPAEQQATAAGEVLGGEISDAMIPLEQLKSQAPLAPRQAPSARDVDGEQPEVAGEASPQSEEAETAPADPAPAPAE